MRIASKVMLSIVKLLTKVLNTYKSMTYSNTRIGSINKQVKQHLHIKWHAPRYMMILVCYEDDYAHVMYVK